jgi:hypothetical protein
MRTVIGIDPGASGGIAVFHRGMATAVKMPKDVHEMNEYIQYLKNTYDRPIVFIERLNVHRGDNDDTGMQFSIEKMLANYNQLLTVIRLSGLPMVQVYPISWQSMYGIRPPKGLEKTQRKAHFKNYAQTCFPEVKVTLATADALCLIAFGCEKINNDRQWVLDKVENVSKKDHTLF